MDLTIVFIDSHAVFFASSAVHNITRIKAIKPMKKPLMYAATATIKKDIGALTYFPTDAMPKLD